MRDKILCMGRSNGFDEVGLRGYFDPCQYPEDYKLWIMTLANFRGTYSSSNWFGRIKSASLRSVLYAGMTSSLTKSAPSSPITGSRTRSKLARRLTKLGW